MSFTDCSGIVKSQASSRSAQFQPFSDQWNCFDSTRTWPRPFGNLRLGLGSGPRCVCKKSPGEKGWRGFERTKRSWSCQGRRAWGWSGRGSHWAARRWTPLWSWGPRAFLSPGRQSYERRSGWSRAGSEDERTGLRRFGKKSCCRRFRRSKCSCRWTSVFGTGGRITFDFLNGL